MGAVAAVSGGETIHVAPDEAGLRLDRWFRRRFPQVSHSLVQKWLRIGRLRVGGRRAKAGTRLAAGDAVSVPPLSGAGPPRTRRTPAIGAAAAAALVARVLHRDDQVLVIAKPPGLAVQGGTGTHRHLDAMLDALRFDAAERPRLVHRLDKDTSGVLVLARTAAAAARLTAAFRSGAVRKLYWAVVVGVPRPPRGRIDLALGKVPGGLGERAAPLAAGGRKAVTVYRIVERAGRKAAWLALEPLTGRTHQLRVHLAALGTPILGDGKYGGRAAFLEGEGIARAMHLHARAIRIPRAAGVLEVAAPLPDHMRVTWRFLGFREADEVDGHEWTRMTAGPG